MNIILLAINWLEKFLLILLLSFFLNGGLLSISFAQSANSKNQNSDLFILELRSQTKSPEKFKVDTDSTITYFYQDKFKSIRKGNTIEVDSSGVIKSKILQQDRKVTAIRSKSLGQCQNSSEIDSCLYKNNSKCYYAFDRAFKKTFFKQQTDLTKNAFEWLKKNRGIDSSYEAYKKDYPFAPVNSYTIYDEKAGIFPKQMNTFSVCIVNKKIVPIEKYSSSKTFSKNNCTGEVIWFTSTYQWDYNPDCNDVQGTYKVSAIDELAVLPHDTTADTDNLGEFIQAVEKKESVK